MHIRSGRPNALKSDFHICASDPAKCFARPDCTSARYLMIPSIKTGVEKRSSSRALTSARYSGVIAAARNRHDAALIGGTGARPFQNCRFLSGNRAWAPSTSAYIYIYIYMCVYIYIYVYICIYIYIYTYIHTHTHTLTHTCMYTYTYTCTLLCCTV